MFNELVPAYQLLEEGVVVLCVEVEEAHQRVGGDEQEVTEANDQHSPSQLNVPESLQVTV